MRFGVIIPVILAGGSGTRLWPVSRLEYPKQFAPILGKNELTLFQKAVLRTQKISNVFAPIIICNQQHKHHVDAQLQQLGVFDAKIILEPVGRNTAPAISIAALLAKAIASNPVLLVLPADHLIADEPKFIDAVNAAYKYACEDALLCFGIMPQSPETGYGYIKVGQKLGFDNVYVIDKFVEKPNLELAQKYVNSGEFLWNGGIFMFRADSFLHELQSYAQDIFNACVDTMKTSALVGNSLTLSKGSFDACRSESIDYAVMEHTKKALVVKLDAAWSDIGSWLALWEKSEKDQANNVLIGNIIAENSQNSYIHAGKRQIVAIGVKDHIIVETDDVVLVLPKSQAQDLQHVITKLNAEKN